MKEVGDLFTKIFLHEYGVKIRVLFELIWTLGKDDGDTEAIFQLFRHHFLLVVFSSLNLRNSQDCN